MQLELSTPALLFPAVAILMLGYVNRYTSVAGVIRTFRKDYDSGYKHVDLIKQLKILYTRIQLLKLMLTGGALALILACLSMLLVFLEQQVFGQTAFALSLIFMVSSLLLALYETSLSNKSLAIEIQDIFRAEKQK